MNHLEDIHHTAIKHTKTKIFQDIDQYLGSKDKPATYSEYLAERSFYLQQIWLNIWLNNVTNKFSRIEKSEYLSEKGIEVEQTNRKLINHLFRTEMKSYEPFEPIEWLHGLFAADAAKWVKRHDKARVVYFEREQEKKLLRRKYEIQEKVEHLIDDIIENSQDIFYVYIRNFIAKKLAHDLKNKPKYREVDTFALEEKLVEEGDFDVSSYSKMGDFLTELTGNIHKTIYRGKWYFEYETYYFAYSSQLNTYLVELMQRIVIEQLPADIFEEYEHAFSKSLTGKIIMKSFTHSLEDLTTYFIENIQEEFLADLIKLTLIPFDITKHLEIYKEELTDRERKEAEAVAEKQRKEEEEARMIEDIFGRQYRPDVDRSIRYYLHIGDTNTGKTHQAIERIKNAESALYLAPLRLLALEVYDKLNKDGIPCTLKTGEEEKTILGANHVSSTVEMFHEKEFYDVIVIDEAQMITDKDRGFSWYKAITKANANEVHIIGSRNAKSMMLQLLGDAEIEIFEYKREIPLQVEEKEFRFKEVKKGDALICFSRRRVLETASRLQNDGHSISMIYGSMPPETRKKQVQRFINGETSIIVSTDAIGMGLNLPIRRIVFLENEKFDGTRRRVLTSQEVKQIAGRAGRKGLYDIGKVSFMKDIKLMKRLLEQEDEPVHTFAIAPTNFVFERFQKYFRDLGTFFELWDKFKSPKGTKKASLTEERELYDRIRGTEIEARIAIMDLYGFLHLPFSKKEPELTRQWENTMYAIIDDTELPEPRLKNNNLEDLELSYKAIGLHLLFLYRLEQRTEAIYWERMREEISDHVHERLNTDIKNLTKKCKRCGKKLAWEHEFQICDDCHDTRSRRNYPYYRG